MSFCLSTGLWEGVPFMVSSELLNSNVIYISRSKRGYRDEKF
jgi:hypothetical protein